MRSKKQVSLDLYKTKVCLSFQSGICLKGDQCTYAHTIDQLRKRPELQKTKICKQFQQGMCLNGIHCKFAHGQKELSYTPDLYKTDLCYNFGLGKCQLSSNQCRYAHGVQEQRIPNQSIDQSQNGNQQFGGFKAVSQAQIKQTIFQDYDWLSDSPILLKQYKRFQLYSEEQSEFTSINKLMIDLNLNDWQSKESKTIKQINSGPFIQIKEEDDKDFDQFLTRTIFLL